MNSNQQALDLHQCFTGAEQRKRLLHHLEALHETNPSQDQLRNFLRAVDQSQLDFCNFITSIWIELDQDDLLQGQTIPNVFVGFKIAASDAMILAVLHQLQPDLSDPTRKQISRLAQLSQRYGGQLAHFGVMMSRATSAVRMNFQGIQRIDAVDFLDRAGWCDDLEDIAEFLTTACGLSRRRNIALDIGETVFPKLGVEIFPDYGSPRDSFWQALLAELVDRGLADSHKVSDVLAFQGTLSPVNEPDCWPDSLMIDHLFAPQGDLPWMLFRISHVKLSWLAGNVSAKIYLVAEPFWQHIESVGSSQSRIELAS